MSEAPDSSEDAEVFWNTPISSKLESSGIVLESGAQNFVEMGWSVGSTMVALLLAAVVAIGRGRRPGKLLLMNQLNSVCYLLNHMFRCRASPL